jgi:hypothetical protein
MLRRELRVMNQMPILKVIMIYQELFILLKVLCYINDLEKQQVRTPEFVVYHWCYSFDDKDLKRQVRRVKLIWLLKNDIPDKKMSPINQK